MASRVSQERLQTARDVISRLGRSASFREAIAVNQAGERPILVATVDDRMADLLRQMESTGLPATLCVRGGSASFTVATIRPVEPDDHPVDSAPIDPTATVGMFIAWLWTKGVVFFHLERSQAGAVEYEVEFV